MFTICSALRFLNLKPNHHLHICIMPTKPARQLRLPQSESGFHVQTSAWTPCRYLGKRKNSVAIKQVSCSLGVSGLAGAKSVPIPQEQSQENVHAQGRDCNQPYKRGSWPLASPAGSRCWAEAAANICGQHWRTTHALPVPSSARLIRHRGFLEGRHKKEEQEERKDSIYQHLTCTSRDSSTTSPRGAGQGIALSIGLRRELLQSSHWEQQSLTSEAGQCSVK